MSVKKKTVAGLVSVLLLLVMACNEPQSLASTEKIPENWQQLTDRGPYLEGYEKYINHLPDLPLPLSKVYTGPDSTIVYRGLVVGQRAEKATKFICRADSCTLNIATSLVQVKYTTEDEVTINLLLADQDNNATYLLATIDSTRQQSEDHFSLLQSFMNVYE